MFKVLQSLYTWVMRIVLQVLVLEGRKMSLGICQLGTYCINSDIFSTGKNCT